MKLYYIPWGDNNTASTRLRVFNIVPHLGVECLLGTPERYGKDDILIIQKRPHLADLLKAKQQKIKVIYDIDDYYWDKPEYLKMVQQADLVTTDTEEKARLLKYDNKNVKVIPDSLDWDGTIKQKYEHKGIIGWTGYGNNSQYLNDFEIPEGFKLRLITSPDWINYYKDLNAQSRPWSLEMVDKYLAECDLGVYYLPEGKFEQVKGMHKLLKNWAIGLPTFTSPMPDYVKAMEEAGAGKKYLGNIKDIDFDPKLREYALRYEAKEVAKLWKSALTSL